MLNRPGTQQFADNNPLAVGKAGQPVRIYSVDVISGASATTVKLYNGTSVVAGNQYSQVDGTASKNTRNDFIEGKRFPNGCYLSTDANTAFVSVSFEQEF